MIGQLDREKGIELCEGKGPQIAAVARTGSAGPGRLCQCACV